MSRLLLGVVVGAAVAIATMTALGLHAQEAPTPDVEAKAEQVGVDPIDLQGALNTTGYDAETYLCLVGEGPCPKPPPVVGSPGIEARLACAVRFESHGNPGATNPRSGAAGLYQFVGGTWLTTPQGKAGLSPYDPVAAHAAAVWLASQRVVLPGGRVVTGFEIHWAADVALGC